MPFPNSNGCATFQLPPLDGSLTLIEVVDYNGTQNSKHALFRYEDTEGVVRDILWGKAVTAIHETARIVKAKVGATTSPVAILASLDAITYYTLIVGIMRAGYVPFPISSRNSPAAVASLIESTGTKQLIITHDHATLHLVQTARDHLADPAALVTIDAPYFQDLYGDNVSTDLLPPLVNASQDSPAVILHSSGSTAFPKPITIPMRVMMENGLAPYYGEIEFCKVVQASHGLPMFHLMGVIQISWTTFAGMTMAVFPPTHPPVVPTPDNVFEAAVSNRCTTVLCVPAFLEVWFKNAERRKTLNTFDLVMFAGGPLEPSVGDALVHDGVNIAPVYGMTECGATSLVLPKSPPPEGWAYWRLSGHLDATLIPYDETEGTWSLILKQCPTHHPSILNTTIDGVPALNTNDLVMRHPKNPDLLCIYGRSDDQIMHSTGEKTNPIPMEAILSRDSRISSAIMFGTSRFHTGVIITPTADHVFDPLDTDRLAKFRNTIWKSVELANEHAPSHSRIFKEMILVAHPSKPFEYTPKLTPRRKAVLATYADEINAAYNAVKESSQVDMLSPNVWDEAGCFEFARRAIDAVLTEKVGDNEDIFQGGCDSLQATWIKNTIIHALNTSSSIDTRKLSHNFVYENPTARKLGSFLLHLFSESERVVDPTEQMKSLASKYSTDFPSHFGDLRPSSEVVLITGTTGALGSQLLSSFLLAPDIAKVYALNRPSTEPVLARQSRAFQQRALDTSLLTSEKLVLLEADLVAERFGLDARTYEKLREDVTCIIHNAWNVNFKLSLASMEPLLLGTRNLVNLALSSKLAVPPRFVFTSSIGVFVRQDGTQPAVESHIADPAVSAGQGYSESKWCAEKILHEASIKTALELVVVRVGQLCGDRSSGAWNVTEWFPSLVGSSYTLKAVPRVPGVVSWLPIDTAADIIIELRNSKHSYVNLVHPSPTRASIIFESVASSLGVPVIPYAAWLSSLEASSTTPSQNNPALRLLEFFRTHRHDTQDDDGEIFGLPTVDHALALKNSKGLAGLRNNPLTVADVDRWIGFWKKAAFL